MNGIEAYNPGGMQLIRVQAEGPDAIEEHEVVVVDPEETAMSLAQILAMRHKKVRWRCWLKGCRHEIPCTADQLDSVPFLIVRHLCKDHGKKLAEIVADAPGLAPDVREYCEAMGVETPVGARTGVSTVKMGMPR